ncbi:MAG: DNA/RNA nuclease SfsA [Lachnospiraceae bacterium]|nr:DNA/RNA nuclease SfsA [Lachnospiraceae bacterium]
MKYANVCKGIFLERPNRFIAHVEIDGKREICHVKNTGRCKELLVPGCQVYLTRSDQPKRKTAYDLIAVQKGNRLINMDSQIPNAAAYEWIASQSEELHIAELKREVRHGNSRFDLWGKKSDGKEFFVEVKGVTLEEDGIVRFPDAPTERGIKHVEELENCVKEGYGAAVLFVIQMEDVKWFEPNMATHAAFGEALKKAQEAGVLIKAVCCKVKPDEMYILEEVEVRIPL